MKTEGKIALSMIPEFESGMDDVVALRAYAVLDRIYIKHMSEAKALTAYGVTWEQVQPYEREWASKRNRELVYS